MSFQHRYGPMALVAGASEGIGAAFAERLAARGLGLLLIARREAPLLALADDLRARHRVVVRTAALDLGAPDLLPALRAATAGLDLGLLVYNAAASSIGPFLAQPLDAHLRIVDVNVRGPLVLAHELGRGLVARRRGGIILMSSVAASQGSPLIASYAASKAFDLVLGEALWDELRGSGVDVLACRAGATTTPAYARSQPRSAVPTQPPEAVAEEALRALGQGPSLVTGRLNRAAAFALGRLLPRRLAVQLMGSQSRKMYG